MPSPSNVTGSVADLFATLGLDASPIAAEMVSVKGLIQGFASDAIVSLKSIQESVYATADQMGIKLGQAATGATVVAEALTQMMISGQSARESLLGLNVALNDTAASELRAAAAMNEIEAQIASNEAKRIALAKESAVAEKASSDARILRFNQQAEASSRAAAIEQVAADARVFSANQVAAGEARAAAIEAEAANARVALANEVAIGTARAEAMQTEAVDAAVKARILRYNQEAEAEMRAAAIRKEAEAADSIPMRLGLRAGPGGVSPTVGSGASGLIAGGVAIIAGYEAVKQFTAFDDAMNKSLSIMKDVTEFQKSEMVRVAKDLSVQYGISAVEIAHAFYTLESAGRTTGEALAEMPAVAQFAFTASADGIMKMSTAAETLTSVFNALKGSGVSIEHIGDLLLKADSIAQGTGEQFAKALAGKGAGAIQILGKSAEEGLAILSTMAKAGIPAAQQQTALIQILRDLPKEAEKYSNVIITLNGHQMTFKELLYDSSGQMKDFAVILKELETLFAGASTEVIQHDLALLHLNSRTNQSIQAMLGLSGVLADHEKQYRNVTGAMKGIADIRLTAVKTDFERLGEAIRLAAIDLGTALTPAAGFFSRQITNTLVTVHDLTAGIMELGKVAYHYAKGDLASFSPKAPAPPTAPPPGIVGSGSVFDPEAEAKRKAKEDRLKAAAEREANIRNQIATVTLEMQKRQEEAAIQLEIDGIKRREQLHEVSAADSLQQLRNLEDAKIEIETRYAQKRLALEETKKTPLFAAKTNAILADAQIAQNAADQRYALDVLAETIKQKATLKKMDDEIAAGTDKLQTKFDLAWGKYHEGVVKAQAATTEISVSIHDRLPAAMVPAYDAAIHLEQSFKKLGMSAVDAAGNAQSAWIEPFSDIAKHARSLEEVEGAWGAISRRVAQLGKTDIPLVVKLQNEYIAALVRTHAPLVQVLEAQEDMLKTTIELKTRSGEFNDDDMIALENLRIRTQALRDSTHELGLMYLETTHNVSKLWKDFGDGVADGILAGGKFWAFWKDIIKEFEKEMLRTVVNGVLKSVKDAILGLPGVTSTLGKVFGGVFGAGGSVAGAGQQAASLTQGTAATAANTTALGANTTAETGNTTAVTANTAAMTGDTAATTANAVATGVNAVATTADAIVTGVNTAAIIGKTATEVSSTITYAAVGTANSIATTANTAATVALTAATAADTAATTAAATASAAGGVASAAGGVASGVAGAAGQAGASAIVGMVTGAIQAVSAVIGNFQMMAMNKSLDLIENYTRYLKIGLVEQGDSLLNDSHIIRNTLTDFMAYNWGTQATYFQQICEKLDALIGGGGIPGITSKPQMAFAGVGTSEDLALAGSEMSNDHSVSVDLRGSTFSGGVTDEQVTSIFNRGIDKAKRAGAFRGGQWPR